MKLSALRAALEKLEEESRLRVPDDSLLRARMQEQFGASFLDAASNDYLGLGGSSQGTQGTDVSRETAPPRPGSGASRLIFGSSPEHLRVEAEVAGWLGYPAALLFSSGYSANLGALACLLSPDDAVFSDRLNHASLIDGMRLAKVQPEVFPHLDLGALELGLRARRDAPARWVVVESYYSMDGDGPDLGKLRALCDRYDAALYVDEAHAVGTFGERGAGLCASAGMRADVLVAAFGKAVGSQGACVLGSRELRTWLWNRARSFVFSTAPSPLLTASLARQIHRTQQAEAERSSLGELAESVRRELVKQGVPLVPESFGPVLSLVAGTETQALAWADALRREGILAQAIRPPTVPPGESRVRLILRASCTKQQVAHLLEIVARETSRRI